MLEAKAKGTKKIRDLGQPFQGQTQGTSPAGGGIGGIAPLIFIFASPPVGYGGGRQRLRVSKLSKLLNVGYGSANLAKVS